MSRQLVPRRRDPSSDGEPVIGPAGMPTIRELWFRADETEIIDTWTSTGLRGTASHDYAVDDVFVPAERSCWFMEPPTEPGPLYQMAPIAMFATFISAVPLGIARHTLDEFVALSQRNKVPVLSQDVLADKPVANTKLGRAKALVESGHAYVRSCLAEQWAAVCDGRRPTMADRGAARLAATHAGQTALEAIELLYGAAGADAVYATSALDRCLRRRPNRGAAHLHAGGQLRSGRPPHVRPGRGHDGQPLDHGLPRRRRRLTTFQRRVPAGHAAEVPAFSPVRLTSRTACSSVTAPP